MNISLTDIKKLRELTKAGIIDCRQALEASKGSLKEAQKWLAEKGKLTALKKKDRTTKAGLIEAYIHHGGQVGALIKVVCETDFVGRTKDFQDFCHEVAMQVASMNPKSVAILLEQDYIRDPQKKIKDLLNDLIAKTGENIKIELVSRLEI